MKVLFAALVVLISLTMTKGSIIEIAWQMICKTKVEKPGKVNEMRECMGKILKEKSDGLQDALRECEFAKFPYEKYEDYLNELCKKEKYADVQEINQCVAEKFAAVQKDPESALSEMIDNCF